MATLIVPQPSTTQHHARPTSKMARKNKTKVALDDENDDCSEDEEPNFSDPEDFVDDISEEELVGDILRSKPKETDGVESVIVVDGIPIVGEERLEKLKNVVRKAFKEFGIILNEFYPMSNGKTKGHIFIEYKDRESAEEAVRMRNNHKLDKNHTFLCNLFTDFDKYSNIPEEFVPPAPQPYKDTGDLYSYLNEENCFDQYLIIYDGGQTTAIYENSVPEPKELEKREHWTETYVKWSPRGTYLATFHGPGVALWGGEKFERFQKFNHPGAQFIDFSPGEKYIVTFSPQIDQRSEEPVIIWDILTGQKKRSFSAERVPMWPIFKWSFDDKYFARIGEDILSVYETPSFGLLDKKSIKVPGIKDFSWSPTDNVLAYWIAEDKDVPAKVSLITIPVREEIRTKNLFSVLDCKMYWQKCGDYLCVKVARYSKAKREKNERNEIKYSGTYYNFEIFQMREKGIPVDSLETKENILAFAWEPVNNKFGIISSGDGQSINVTFYQVNKGQVPSELKKFEKRSCNNLFWSPNGQFVVLAGLGSMTGTLEFVDTKDFVSMATAEHLMATEVEWDPTGRYVASYVSFLAHKLDNAYWIWSFQGKCLGKHQMNRFCHLLWRPRPPSLLGPSDIEELKKNMKQYSSTFKVQDKMRFSKASKEIIEKRQKQMEEFLKLRKEATDRNNNEAAERLNLRSGVDLSAITEEDEEIVEFLIKKEVIIVDE